MQSNVMNYIFLIDKCNKCIKRVSFQYTQVMYLKIDSNLKSIVINSICISATYLYGVHRNF